MLYLLTPPYGLKWADIPETALELIRENGGDLGKLDWQDAEEPHRPAMIIHLAMRHGEPCSRGIVFPAWIVGDVARPSKLARGFAGVQASEANLAENDQLMEARMPGWTEQGRTLMADLEQSTHESIAEAERKASELLDAPELPHVVSAWQRMGGLTSA